MTNKKIFAVGLIFALLGLGAIFLWLNFQVAKSVTKADQQISTYSSGFEKGESLQSFGPLTLVVEGNDRLSRTFARLLERNLLNGGQTQVIREQNVRSAVDHFQVVVTLKEDVMFWSPFFAQSRLEASFAFSSNGDLSWRDQDTIAFSSEQGQVVAVRGNIQITDTSYGLISQPAYLSHLADEIVVRIDEAIRRALASPTNPGMITDP